MTIIDELKKAKEIIENNGGVIVKDYTLINNYGVTFELNEIPYDARHWINCYGCEVNYYEVHKFIDYKNDDKNRKVIEKIKDELNKMIMGE